MVDFEKPLYFEPDRFTQSFSFPTSDPSDMFPLKRSMEYTALATLRAAQSLHVMPLGTAWRSTVGNWQSFVLVLSPLEKSIKWLPSLRSSMNNTKQSPLGTGIFVVSKNSIFKYLKKKNVRPVTASFILLVWLPGPRADLEASPLPPSSSFCGCEEDSGRADPSSCGSCSRLRLCLVGMLTSCLPIMTDVSGDASAVSGPGYTQQTWSRPWVTGLRFQLGLGCAISPQRSLMPRAGAALSCPQPGLLPD